MTSGLLKKEWEKEDRKVKNVQNIEHAELKKRVGERRIERYMFLKDCARVGERFGSRKTEKVKKNKVPHTWEKGG